MDFLELAKNRFSLRKFSDKKVAEYPFPRIPYKEAMVKYGCDKPDLRNPLIIIDVTDFFQRCTFKPFHDRTVRAIKIKGHQSKGFHEKMLAYAQSIGMGGLGYLEVQEDMSYKGPIDKFIPDDMKSELKDLAGLEVEDTIFFIADNETNANNFLGNYIAASEINDVNGIYTISSDDLVVKYYENGVLEYYNYDVDGSSAEQTLAEAYTISSEFIKKDTGITNDLYLSREKSPCLSLYRSL